MSRLIFDWSMATPEDFPEQLRGLLIDGVLDLKAVISIVEILGGERVYVPTFSSMRTRVFNRLIREELLRDPSVNVFDVARRYGYSRAAVERLLIELTGKPAPKAPTTDPKQKTLFGGKP